MPASEALRIEQRPVRVAAGRVTLDGDLGLPQGAQAVVLFAHGSGSGRYSSRNRQVARLLNEAKLATLLIDLLTVDEEVIDAQTAHLRFDIALLARRLVGATDWLIDNDDTRTLNIGYFGASTGAGAALVAAAERRDVVGAVDPEGEDPIWPGRFCRTCKPPHSLSLGATTFQSFGSTKQHTSDFGAKSSW